MRAIQVSSPASFPMVVQNQNQGFHVLLEASFLAASGMHLLSFFVLYFFGELWWRVGDPWGRGKGVGEGQRARGQGERAGEKREWVFMHEVAGIRFRAGDGREDVGGRGGSDSGSNAKG